MTNCSLVIRIETCVGRVTCLLQLERGFSTSHGVLVPVSASLRGRRNQGQLCRIVYGTPRPTEFRILILRGHSWLTFGLTMLPTQSVAAFLKDCRSTARAPLGEGSFCQPC